MIILGVNYQQIHDSSACIVRDGKVLFATAEERLSRIKHDRNFPIKAIEACLDYAQVKPQELDYICFGWPRPHKAYLHELKSWVKGAFPVNAIASTYRFVMGLQQRGGMNQFTNTFGATNAKVLYVDHHLAHAISAYAFSGFQEATIVVIDGRGSWETTSIWYGHDGKIDHILTMPWPNSLGLFYAEFTHYLGFQRYSDEWKVMGLAPYGRPGVDLKEFIDLNDAPYRVNANQLLRKNVYGDASPIEAILGPKRLPESEIDQRHKDIAFAVQEACERGMLAVVEMAVAKTKCRNLCLAGGVALNSKANGKILTSGTIERIFIQPAATDDGTALGAALAPYLETTGSLPMAEMRSAYLGTEYSDPEIETLLNTYKLRYTHLSNPPKSAAELLAAGKIIGWFQGRMEFGPRALGNRSILADPRNPDMKDKVNNAVKFREAWRPFAPSLLAEAAPDYLDNVTESPFMILTDAIKSDKQSVVPAITHVDGSARPQTVKKEVNPLYWNLIKEFENLTGVPVVMNTSFNLRGEAIVCTPTEAIRTFSSSGMDALILGSYLVEK
jgi:carbamoyltransferase